MKTFIFGAGSTKGTLFAPVSSEFGRCLNHVDPGWRARYPVIDKIVKYLFPDPVTCNDWGLEPVWSFLDYDAKFGNVIGHLDPSLAESGSRQIKKALLEIYGNRCHELAAQLKANLPGNAGEFTLGVILKDLKPNDRVISFNYDTLVEQLAAAFQTLCADPGPLSHSKVLLVKPHGSVSWTLALPFNRNSNVIWRGDHGEPLFRSLTASDVDNHNEPLVLGAVPIKSELIWEVQCVQRVPDVFPTILNQWNQVVEAIRHASSLVIVGYSFPPEDQYGRFLIEEGVRRRLRDRPGSAEIHIDYYDALAQAPETFRRITQLFGRCLGSPLRYCGPVRHLPSQVDEFHPTVR